jgi:hypothetical protein
MWSTPMKDDYLNLLDVEELFGNSAEKIAEFIISSASTSRFKVIVSAEGESQLQQAAVRGTRMTPQSYM